MGTLSALLKALEQYFRWRAADAESRTKTFLFDRIDLEEEKIHELEKQVSDCRKHGDHARADELLLRATRRSTLRQGLLDLAGGTNMDSTTESNPSRVVGSGTEG